MTLIVLEGVSASGKSTIRDELLDRHPEWIRWKGENLMRKGPGDDWKEYQRRYHEALHRLYELNPENIIVADRAFSDIAYNSDAEFRNEMRRLAACYGDVRILYFFPGEYDPDHDETMEEAKKVLADRGSRDIHQVSLLVNRYRTLLQMFPHQPINTADQTVTEAADEAEDYIMVSDETIEHAPDI